MEKIETHDVMPDFVDGWAFGDAVGVGLRSKEGWWSVAGVEIINRSKSTGARGEGEEVHSLDQVLNLITVSSIRLAPTQTRILSLKLTQAHPLPSFTSAIPLRITLVSVSSTDKTVVEVELPVKHVRVEGEGLEKVKASYLYAGSMPSEFVVLPPVEKTEDLKPVVLGLRRSFTQPASLFVLPRWSIDADSSRMHSDGAGVDVISMPFWAEAIPKQKYSWVVLPTGRTAWVGPQLYHKLLHPVGTDSYLSLLSRV